MKNELESSIQRAVCDYLALKKYFFWRSNTTPIFDKTRGRFRSMPKYAKMGVPDVLLVKSGNLWGLEIKRTGGAISAHQRDFKAGLEAAGGIYHIIKSVDDVIALGL